MTALLLHTRAELVQSGWDFGPLSVLNRLERAGVEGLPSRATIARLFTAAGVVIPQPRKRPRASWRRFVNPHPNGSWQIDATGWALADGSKVVIFQVTDDHSRLAVASVVAVSETSDAAVAALKIGVERYGIPARVHSDNGMALNPVRRGATSAMVEYLAGLGVETVTGRPYRPTTQGKNERSHQTLHRFLRAHPAATSTANLQLLVDEFDQAFNTQRPHQALSDHATPIEAWLATPRAVPTPQPATSGAKTQLLTRRADTTGTIAIAHARYHLGIEHARTEVRIILNANELEIFNDHGTHIRTVPRGNPGDYVRSGLPRTRRKSHPK